MKTILRALTYELNMAHNNLIFKKKKKKRVKNIKKKIIREIEGKL